MNRKTLRVVKFALLGVGLLMIWACIQRPMKRPTPNNESVQLFIMPQSNERDVDILFVIDNSISMGDEQANVRAQFVTLMQTLQSLEGGLPNVHLGVVSTDVGTGNFTTIGNCEEVGGDRGVLGKVGSVNRGEVCIGQGQRYIVDVEPAGCEIVKDEDDQGNVVCQSHSCAQQNCQAVQDGNEILTLNVDANGCPRCRNYQGTLEDTFSCLADLGTAGCGFEQQFEAMYKALDVQSTPENHGFLRDSALLAVVMITDEDDCSASQPGVIFNPDPAENKLDSTLGYLHSFRCFEFGIACNEGGRGLGPRQNCNPRPEEDPVSLLHPLTRYTAYLEAIRDPLMTVVATIGGPWDNGTLTVVPDSKEPEKPSVAFSCQNQINDEGATPGVRLKAFTAHFNSTEDMGQWAYTSVCNTDFTAALKGVGDRIVEGLSEICPVSPFSGCPLGPAGTTCSACLPSCTVYDIEDRLRPGQKKVKVPWCGTVCTTGLCTESQLEDCGDDGSGRCVCQPPFYPTRLFGREGCAPLHYPGGVPETDRDRDAQLATLVPREEPSCVGEQCPDGSEGRASACWYLSSESTCSFGVGFRVVRADDPPPRTFAEVRCKIIPEQELLCTDGKDNDQDCLVDNEDPDCVQ